MAMQRAIFLVSLALMAMLIQLGMAANHDVGDNGWDTSSDVATWASSRTFLVGDNLVFKYSPMHNVVEVSKSDYDSCQATTIVQAFSDGNTVIPLKAAGKRYFMCGTPGHCSMGMKLAVNTLATTASSPPPKAALPPRSGTSPSPAASSPEAAAAPAASSTPPLSDDAPSSDDNIPSALPVAPSTSQTSETAALSPSSAPARGGFRDGLVMGLFGVIVMVLTF